MTDTWQTREWKDKAAEFTKDKACEWCGALEKLVPHHPRRKDGYTHDQYMDLSNCIMLCSNCNFKESQGYRICPNCKKNYYKPKKNREALCWKCFVKTPFGKTVNEYYENHPEQMSKKMKKLRSIKK